VNKTHRTRQAARILTAALVLALLHTSSIPAASGAPSPSAVIRHEELREISGLAVSRLRPDLLWVLNDSGNPPALYAVTTNGNVEARVEVANTANEDWEDLASFRRDGTAWLLVADCGDNLASRPRVVLWIVREPHCEAATPPTHVHPALGIQLTYADGPRDVEAVAVDEASGLVLLLSKRDVPPRLCAVDMPATPWTGQTVVAQARLMAELGTWTRPPGLLQGGLSATIGSQPTAMDFDSIHRRLLVLTYTDAWWCTVPSRDGWSRIESAAWHRIALPDPREGWLRRREAIACSHDGAAAFLTSEGRDPHLVCIALPAAPAAEPATNPAR